MAAGQWTPAAAQGAAALRQQSCPLPTPPAPCPGSAASRQTPRCHSLAAALQVHTKVSHK